MTLGLTLCLPLFEPLSLALAKAISLLLGAWGLRDTYISNPNPNPNPDPNPNSSCGSVRCGLKHTFTP